MPRDADQTKADRIARRALESTRADGETEQQHRERVATFAARLDRFRRSQEVPF
jgi:hypothetical protein